jgi:hypothetical protein
MFATGMFVIIHLHHLFGEKHMAKLKTQSTGNLRVVLDPRGQPTATVRPSPLASRLKTLQGKTVYVIDIGFGGGYEFLEEAVVWLQKSIPSAKIELRRKPGHMFMETPELWTEIKTKGDAVILGVGG